MYSKNILLIVSVSFLLIAGCGRSKEAMSPEDKVIARVNNYELTVADFNDGLKTTIAHKFLATDPVNAKEDILEELITRKVLVQEAQKENFDKERSFMRQIERYWEQTLVKALLKKKLQEISEMIHVDKNEILSEYNKMKGEVSAEKQAEFPSIENMEGEIKDIILRRKKEILLEKWVDGLRMRASVKIDKKALHEIEVR
ncbi:MAG: SurA N-terminal domain-containing protein [Candidatus Omnitrophota bacterium]|nr:SurA N-terminal domain-containing protein [Candidatus Omnitrophota bacterium]